MTKSEKKFKGGENVTSRYDDLYNDLDETVKAIQTIFDYCSMSITMNRKQLLNKGDKRNETKR